MFILSKIVGIGSLVSGISGLSTYLILYSLGNSSNSKLNNFFKSSNSIYNNQDINNFEEKEKQILGELKSLFQKMNIGKKGTKSFKEVKEELMEKTFSFISQTEIRLTSIYQKNIDILKKLAELSEKHNEESIKKLKAESDQKLSQQLISLLEQIVELLKSRKEFFNKFICAIDKKEESQCERLKGNDSNNSLSSSNPSNGGGTEGQKAHQKLEEVKKNLIQEVEKIKYLIHVDGNLKTIFSSQKGILDIFIKRLDSDLKIIKTLSDGLIETSKLKEEEGNE